ncbi:hypothetical protein [Ectobacillus polymachus]|uniref:hypothetical protein n=1 Tax=Ectobacillus polymachus TaxID=1508806 RepID=UPI003A8C768A
MKFINKFIGFRSGNSKNKVIASLGYIVFVLGFLGQISSGPTIWDSFVHTLGWSLLFLFALIPFTNTFSIRRKLFFFNRKSVIGKAFGILSYTVIVFILSSVVGIGMESATAKQLEAKHQVEIQAQANAVAHAKADADAKAKADADAKAKADSDAKAKADADAKAKADADAKAKADADAKAKADADAKAKADADAKAKADADAKAKADADAKAKADADAKANYAQTQQIQSSTQQANVEIFSVSSPAPRNSTATLRAKVTPGATASIAIHYKSGDSHAQGLEPKQADANGNVSWSWHVGGNTTLGSVSITVMCNGASSDTQFTVVH